MNQSVGTDSFGKSLLEKRPDILQQESVNDLWKGSFSSSQDTVQNTNEVYENLLRICEGLDAALPEIQSTVNKGGLHIAEHNENNGLEAPFLPDTFDDIETSLDDIEIYGDIMNPVMLGNDYQSLFFNQNFDPGRTNLQSFAPDPYIPLDSCFPMNSANSLDQNQIFADNEIEQYLTHSNFKLNSENFAPDRAREREDDEDPLQLWRKLNCKKVQEIRDLEDNSCEPSEQVEVADKPAKSVLAIFDFTLPSFSSSASSYVLSSPEEKAPTQDEASQAQKSSKPTSPSIEGRSRKCKTSLPILVKPAPESENPSKEKADEKKSLEILQQDLVLSSSSRESSPTPIPTPGTSKSCKRTKPQSTVIEKKSKSSDPARCSKTRKKHKKKKSSEDSVARKSKITSPTLKAGAAYIERQLSTLQNSKKKAIKPDNPKQTAEKLTRIQKSFKKDPSKSEKRQSRKEKDPKHKKYVTRSSSHSKIKEAEKRKKQKAEKQDDWKWLYCSSLSSSPISTPSTKAKSPSLSSKSSTMGSPKTKTNTRKENDENNNRLKVRSSEKSAKKRGRPKTELRRKH